MTLQLDQGELSATELQAVATLWRRERRVLATSFGGTSMLPAIAPGQAVRVLCGQLPAVGDVIVYRHDGQLRVHRLVAQQHADGSAGWLLTWGDNNALPDEPTSTPRCVGVLEGVRTVRIPVLRRLLLAWLRWRSPGAVQLGRRIAFLYRVRAAWLAGPRVFASKTIKALTRRSSPC